MKILHLSTSDIDGGAARAAFRLHQGLLNTGFDSRMLVRAKFSKNPFVLSNKTILAQLGSKLDELPLKQYPKRDRTMFSIQWFPDSVVDRVRQLKPDILHLHWTCNGYLKIESLAKFQIPIVWTLHDMWAFTGGCHYSRDCDSYVQGCGNCPQLHSTGPNDLSHKTWLRKAKAWQNLRINFISPSNWLANCARNSFLLKSCKTSIIPNGIDTQVFKPVNKQLARDILNLPKEKNLILFGSGSPSSDPRKGFNYLLSALHEINLNKQSKELELVVFGNQGLDSSFSIPFKTHCLGVFSDDIALSLVYSAANVFVAPSTQDNLPNTVLESLACGTPCLAFDVGGMPDMITHQENGYLAKPFSSKDLAKGIEWLLEDSEKHMNLSEAARKKVLDYFSIENQVGRVTSLYKTL